MVRSELGYIYRKSRSSTLTRNELGYFVIYRNLNHHEDDGDRIVVRRAGRFNSEDIHKAIFGERKPQSRSTAELKEGIRTYVRKRYARG